jgi:hypothetical protein
MTLRITLLILATFSLSAALSQRSKDVMELETVVTTIDSIVNARKDISEFIHPLFSDNGGEVFLKHHYTVDTIKRLLHKVVYEYVNFEQVTFYYHQQKTIKVTVAYNLLNAMSYKCEYYFDHDSVACVREQGVPDLKNSWNSKTITSQARLYLNNFSGICNMLDRRK